MTASLVNQHCPQPTPEWSSLSSYDLSIREQGPSHARHCRGRQGRCAVLPAFGDAPQPLMPQQRCDTAQYSPLVRHTRTVWTTATSL